jgi:DNA-binding transcriptional regulator YhcF (GntR family)
MEFQQNKPIFLQIAESIYEKILRKEWQEEDRIPSVRELAIQNEVNPNTVQRTYSHLQEREVIAMKRGIGYFVNNGAFERVMQIMREDFIVHTCPQLFKAMDLICVDFAELKKIHDDFS